MRVEWTEVAIADLDRLHDYIAADSAHYARQFTARIVAAVEKLEAFPRIGRPVPEAEREEVRELLFQRYRIIYLLEPEQVQVLAVVHGSRDLEGRESKPWDVG